MYIALIYGSKIEGIPSPYSTRIWEGKIPIMSDGYVTLSGYYRDREGTVNANSFNGVYIKYCIQ